MTLTLLAGTQPGAGPAPTYLDALPILQAAVGHGTLGQYGQLGYEGRLVRVAGQTYAHALSSHPPARLVFGLGGRYTRFACRVALNDDVAGRPAYADFHVRVDDREVALAPSVRAGGAPCLLTAAIAGAQRLELVVQTGHWEYCHAVWLDPQVDGGASEAAPGTLRDCLERVDIASRGARPSAQRCIATVATRGFAGLLDDMLGSLVANGGCSGALLVVFAVDADTECLRVAAKYGATVIPGTARAKVNATIKSVLYSVARVVDADYYLCLDADMLVLDDLRPVFAALEACPPESILACREGNGPGLGTVAQGLASAYGGRPGDLARLLGGPPAGEGAYPLSVNDGLFAGSRTALLALDTQIRAWPQAVSWVDERGDIWWRNQFVFNLALAHLQCGVELDPTYNVQLHVQDVELAEVGTRMTAQWHGRGVRVLHFSGAGRQKYPQWRGRFATVPDALPSGAAGDGYAAFLAALRLWISRHGLVAMAWSFYGTTDGQAARVADPATLPLLALLHYAVRANGCVRVLETGTARGISAACLASAVAHRPGGRVVTFDPFPHAERAALWAALPTAQRGCIEERRTGSLEGLAAALAAGETYEAALLDSIHTAEHVWAEFELAAQLVCPGGLILIHDAWYAQGTVAAALDRIRAAGYGVACLWTAESGVREDDHLGLAVVENRRRSS